MNRETAKKENIRVGEVITLDMGMFGKEDWQVVGLVFDPILTSVALASRDVLLLDLRDVGLHHFERRHVRASDARDDMTEPFLGRGIAADKIPEDLGVLQFE